jgi:ketosteroid isomerase-like protein
VEPAGPIETVHERPWATVLRVPLADGVASFKACVTAQMRGSATTGRRPEVNGQAKAMQPEDVTRLVTERLNAGDAVGVAALYEPHVVLAYPADRPVTGREDILVIYQQMADAGVKLSLETSLPTVRFEDLVLTSARSADNTGVRVQVLRRQLDGSWLRIIDRPEVPSHRPAPDPAQAPPPRNTKPIIDLAVLRPCGARWCHQ